MSKAQSSTAHTTGGNWAGTDGRIHEARVTISDTNFDAVGIAELVSLWRRAGIREFRALDCHETGATVQLEVTSELPVNRMSSLPRTDQVTTISTGPPAWLYVVEFTAPRFPPSVAARRGDLLGNGTPELHADGLTLSLIGPPESIAAVVDEYESNGLRPDIQRFGPYTGPDRPLDALTKRQREVLTTAYEMGYYDVPRTVSTEEVADELDLEPSTVAEHLQRAERNFLMRKLSVTW